MLAELGLCHSFRYRNILGAPRGGLRIGRFSVWWGLARARARHGRTAAGPAAILALGVWRAGPGVPGRGGFLPPDFGRSGGNPPDGGPPAASGGAGMAGFDIGPLDRLGSGFTGGGGQIGLLDDRYQEGQRLDEAPNFPLDLRDQPVWHEPSGPCRDGPNQGYHGKAEALRRGKELGVVHGVFLARAAAGGQGDHEVGDMFFATGKRAGASDGGWRLVSMRGAGMNLLCETQHLCAAWGVRSTHYGPTLPRFFIQAKNLSRDSC